MQKTLPHHQLVLIGVGHTNAHILKMWRMNRPENVALTCISDYPYVTYSGMMPGVLANQYPIDRMRIDLVRACAASGARLIVDEVTKIDGERKQVLLGNRPPVNFDMLSIGIGSTPSFYGVDVDSDILETIKPMQTFLERLDLQIEKIKKAPDLPSKLTIAIVGAGVGGVEIAFCLPNYLKKQLPNCEFDIHLIHGGDHVAKGVTPATEKAIRNRCEKVGVKVLSNSRVESVKGKLLSIKDNKPLECDLVLWATNAVASETLKQIELPQDEKGFLLTRPTLQSVGSNSIFAVGDSGTIEKYRTAKAGVFAVRQGPVLWENVNRFFEGKPLKEYRPQRGFMKLINYGDGTALGDYKGFAFSGKWVWKLKDRIDGKFMDMYQDYEIPIMKPKIPKELPEMKCQGCGGKIGGATLHRLFERLEVPQNEAVLVGLDEPDDAAVIKSVSGSPLAATTDFFTTPVDDPYLAGRIAALNSTSDVFVSGAKPTVALTIATVPEGHPREQNQMLFEVLSGSLREFKNSNISLVGGHTIEGPNLTIGYTILGETAGEKFHQKGDLREGDQLIMTQPLGVGILLAGLMKAKCRHEWYPKLMETLVLDNGFAVKAIEELDYSAITDITGFGLSGHLLEMLKASGFSAKIDLDSISILDGTLDLLNEGVESTLAPDNRWIESEIELPAGDFLNTSLRKAKYASIFDPQTNGGVLVAIRAEDTEKCIELLHKSGFEDSVRIGEVAEKSDEPKIQFA